MTATIFVITAYWIYLCVAVLTLYILSDRDRYHGTVPRKLIATAFWFVFWPWVFIGALIDMARGRRYV